MPTMSENKKAGKADTFLSWTLGVLACLWVAWCCGIGPLYWFGTGLADFGWANVLYMAIAFVVSFAILWSLVRYGRGERVLPTYFSRRYVKLCQEVSGTPTTVLGIMLRHLSDAAHSRPGRAIHAVIVWIGRKLTRCTDCWWKLMLLFVIGWLWIPTTLLAAYGADIRSQIREFSWALNQWTGLKQPYIGFFSFVPMDIYPMHLLKATLAGDIEKMENLGIYEVVEEDFALCEFVDPSKTEMQQIIRDGINLMIKEA